MLHADVQMFTEKPIMISFRPIPVLPLQHRPSIVKDPCSKAVQTHTKHKLYTHEYIVFSKFPKQPVNNVN